MKRNFRIFTFALVALAAGATLAAAWGPGGRGAGDCRGPLGLHGRMAGPGMHPGFGGGEPFALLLEDLDLTEEQTARIRALRDAHREAAEARRQQMGDAFFERFDEELTTDFDEAQVRARAEEHARLRIEAEVERARHRAELLAVLTPEQLAELNENRARFAERRSAMREQREEMRGRRQDLREGRGETRPRRGGRFGRDF